MPERDELFYTRKNAYDTVSAEEKAGIETYCEGYKRFLDAAKTEREAVAEGIRIAEAAGVQTVYTRDEAGPGIKDLLECTWEGAYAGRHWHTGRYRTVL